MNKINTREIKFRVYNHEAKKWSYLLTRLGRFPEGENQGESLNINSNPEYYTIQQFTGLLDKNGVEIYEGDIVKFQWERYEHDIEDDIGEVYWGDGLFLFGRHTEFATNDNNFLKKTLKVVGNLIENPELNR